MVCTIILRQSVFGIAGEPDKISPSLTLLWTPLCAVIIALSPIFICPTTPTWPANTTSLPNTVLPEIPTCPTIKQFSPVRTLCAKCTKLSNLVPLPIRVSPNAARSIVQLAPISTSSSITTTPTCGFLRIPPSTRLNP